MIIGESERRNARLGVTSPCQSYVYVRKRAAHITHKCEPRSSARLVSRSQLDSDRAPVWDAPAALRLETTYWARVIGLFALAIGLRWSFAHASGETDSLATAAYEGDAPKWLDYARSADSNPLAELPLDPPAMPWLAGFLTDGSDLTIARWTMLVIGALIPPLVYATARADLGERVGLIAGLMCACASNLILVGAGLHAEPPFLLLALLGVHALLRLRRGAGGCW